jgi:predicted exporter
LKQRNLFALLWALVLTLTLALGASQWMSKRVALDTDILALLPAPERDPVLQQAFTQMVDSAQQKMIVMVGANDWASAQRAADAYRAVLAPHGDVLQFADGASEQTQQDWLTLFQKHRSVLMTAADETALRKQPAQYWVNGALTKLYSPFAGPQAGGWQDDPFGLFGGWVQQRAQETPVRPRDGYLFVADGDRPYVVMPFTLRVPAFSMNAQNTVTPLLDQARQAALDAAPDAEVLSAGVILHAAAASKQASTEMSIIGIGSVTGIMLLVWFSFRSLKPIGYMLLLVAVGCLGALSICLLLFERVHLLTLVFGATLIGVAQDYGIYFLCNRVSADTATDSSQLLRRLLPSLLLTLAAATVGYTGLTLTPFPGLRQMAVFSISGLVFAWLTVVFWFPVLAGPNSLNHTRFAQAFDTMLTRWPVLRVNWQSALAALTVVVLAVAGWSKLGFNDDIRALQRTPQELQDQQLKLGALLDAPTPVQFYLVQGESAEIVLQREEALKSRLDLLVDQQVLSGYQAISNWVPSTRTQAIRHTLTEEKLLAADAALPTLAARIDEDAAWVEAMRRRATDPAALTPELFLNAPAGAPWRHLWLGKTGNGFASIVALRGVRLAKLPELQDAAIGINGVQWVDKVAEISSVFARYRQYMGWVLLCSYIAVFCLLFARYRASTWRTLAPTIVASTVTIAVLSIAGHSLQLFHVLALMLLLGIGVDYGIFFQERSAQRPAAAWLAVSLSVASTVLAFGLLGLSSTPALQAFGLTMLLGTTLVWLIVPCFRRELMEDACGQS